MRKIKILFLAADPSDAARLRLGQELRDIREKLQLAKQRDSFALESRESVRPTDISQAIFDIEPQIVHFSGHGMSTGELCFENIEGKVKPISTEALANLFELVSKQINCVVLNACFSESQAKAIAKFVPFVIGMNNTIGDKAAIAFSAGFYKALGAGNSAPKAFKFACNEIQLEGIPEHSTPILFQNKSSKSSHINLKKSVPLLLAIAASIPTGLVASDFLSLQRQTKAEGYFNSGVEKIDRDDLQGALLELDQAIRLNPNYVEALSSRGNVHFALGSVEEAFEDLHKAMHLDPNYAEAYINRGVIRSIVDPEGAISDFDKALQIDPKNTLAYFNRGSFYSRQGDLQQAVSDLSKAIDINPDFVEAYNVRGETYSQLLNFNPAIEDFNKAIRLNPNHASAYSNLGSVYFILGQGLGNNEFIDQALFNLDKAIQLKPDFAQAYKNRGDAHSSLGNRELAIQDYQAAADLYRKQGDTEKYHKLLELLRVMP